MGRLRTRTRAMKCTLVNPPRTLWAGYREPFRRDFVLFTLAFFFAAPGVRAQVPTPDTSPTAEKGSSATPPSGQPDSNSNPDNSQSSSRRGSFVIAPIPIASPAVGNGVTVIGAYIF